MNESWPLPRQPTTLGTPRSLPLSVTWAKFRCGWGIWRRPALHLELALATFQEAYGPNHRQVAVVLSNLGVLHWDRRELPGSRTSMERALGIFEAVSEPNHPDVDIAKCLVNLGTLQLDLGEVKEGLPRVERGLAVYAAAYGPNHRDFGRALVNLGIVQLRMWKLREAQASFMRAVPILQAGRRISGPKPH